MKDEKLNFEKNNTHFESEKQSMLDEIDKLKSGYNSINIYIFIN